MALFISTVLKPRFQKGSVNHARKRPMGKQPRQKPPQSLLPARRPQQPTLLDLPPTHRLHTRHVQARQRHQRLRARPRQTTSKIPRTHPRPHKHSSITRPLQPVKRQKSRKKRARNPHKTMVLNKNNINPQNHSIKSCKIVEKLGEGL